MIAAFKRILINMIIIVSFLLALCVAVDYASNNTDITISNDPNIQGNVTFVNESYVYLSNDSGNAISDGKIYTDKKVKVKKQKKVPTVTITSKPSCGCSYGYYWHTMTFKSYCPHCHKTGTLANVHKWPARYEQELTCTYCGADYCGCCGKEKYSWSRYYLTKA